MHFDFDDRSIVRAEAMAERDLIAAIDAGARVVVLEMSCTVLVNDYVGERRHLVRRGESARWIAALPTLLRFLLGWWGIALLHVPGALIASR